MGESVVSIFVYLGIGAVILTSVVIGIMLLGPVIDDIKSGANGKLHSER